MTRPSILSIGTAAPVGTVAQADAADIACAAIGDAQDARTVRAMFRRAGVETRGSVLADENGAQSFYTSDTGADPTTGDRMDEYRRHARALAVTASRDALTRAGVDPSSITHLITASCTGFDAPGPDQSIIHALGLGSRVRRTTIGFMGCHAAINALRVADAFVRADPESRVLVCCIELCSLHLERNDDPRRQVANALFADGAGAAVVAGSDGSAPAITRTDAIIIPDTPDLMTWRVGDHGFEMTLSPRVPGVLAEHVPEWTESWLAERGLELRDIGSWAIHPGGPRVLSTLRDALGLGAEADHASREVLRRHGNMSSATLLFILRRLLDEDAPRPIAAMGFGPGLAGESILFE